MHCLLRCLLGALLLLCLVTVPASGQTERIVLITFGNSVHVCNMILVKGSRLQIIGLLTCLSCWMLWLTPGLSRGGLLSSLDRGYGPTTPGGYTVRVEPYTITMAHSQRSQLSVTVENAAGQPVDDVLVQFRPSEGTVTTGTSHTRGGGRHRCLRRRFRE